MTSLILQTSTRYLKNFMLIFSVFLLLRGHNEPGGGFVGGLMAASGFVLYVLAYDVRQAREVLKCSPQTLIGAGLFIASFSGLWAFLKGQSFLHGFWLKWSTPFFSLELGTPLLFDLGVYFVVLGVILTTIFTLCEELD